jgi:hypothetical protein
MKRALALILIGACVAGAALAQESSGRPGFSPTYESRPGPEDFIHNYPQPAYDQGITGAADLCCTARPDRTLDCRVGAEWPAGHGFGAASLAVAQRFRLTEESYARFAEEEGAWVQPGVRWVVEGTPRDAVSAAFARFNEAVRNVCVPQQAAPEQP